MMKLRRSWTTALLAVVMAAFFTMSCTNCAGPQQAIPKPSVDHMYSAEVAGMVEATTAVLYIKENTIRLIGSAVVIQCEAGKPKRLLTAYHVPAHIVKAAVEGDYSATILIGSHDERRYQQVKLLATESGQDLAMLEGYDNETKACPVAPVAKKLPEIGSTVWVVGNPMGHEKNVSKGVLSAVYFTKALEDQPLVYRVDAAVGPGNSGGPLFNADGELIGIISYMEIFGLGALPGSGHAIALPHLWLLQQKADKVKAEAAKK